MQKPSRQNSPDRQAGLQVLLLGRVFGQQRPLVATSLGPQQYVPAPVDTIRLDGQHRVVPSDDEQTVPLGQQPPLTSQQVSLLRQQWSPQQRSVVPEQHSWPQHVSPLSQQ